MKIKINAQEILNEVEGLNEQERASLNLSRVLKVKDEMKGGNLKK